MVYTYNFSTREKHTTLASAQVSTALEEKLSPELDHFIYKTAAGSIKSPVMGL